MAEVAAKHTRVRVWRGSDRAHGRFDEFAVPYQQGMSVLDALRWIRANADSTLAIRYSCINANACKTCMALVNGAVEYTCTARLTLEGVTVAPLPKRPLVRDIVTDIIPDDERV
jgi:succinate dehydrogenase / fumarate reductase iron-sulfur subunit